MSETFTYRWIDRGVIDGFLHWTGRTSLKVGAFLRNAIDIPIVNGAGDLVGEGVKKAGHRFRVIPLPPDQDVGRLNEWSGGT
jgi:hypothetical protein